MGRRPRSYAALLASAALCGSMLLTSCGGEEPSPPPTGDGTVAGGEPSTAGPTAMTDPPTTSSADPATPSDPTTSPTSKPTKTAEPTKSGTKGPEEAGAPGVPKAARQHTKKGAEAFVRYYNKQLNIAWSKPKSGLLKPLSLSGCKTCAQYEKQARVGEESGEHLDGPSATIDELWFVPSASRGLTVVRTAESNLSRSVLNKHGAVIDTIPESTSRTQVELRWTRDGWRVQEVRELE